MAAMMTTKTVPAMIATSFLEWRGFFLGASGAPD
jgi:hypothetical protein